MLMGSEEDSLKLSRKCQIAKKSPQEVHRQVENIPMS